MKKKFYVTSAIAYPNSKAHLGHALEIIQCDIVARFHRLLGEDVFFQTGTDEHGLKNWQTAKKEGKDVLDFLDANVSVFKELYSKLNISYDNFIRTSDKKLHYPGVQKLWKCLDSSGDLYKKKYKGLYCSGCEAFKTEKELVDGKCPNHPTKDIDEIEEENYFFKLSKYKDVLIDKIKSDEYKIIPESRKNEILAWLPEANDISFSRPKSTLPWGIPVPNDPEHVMYVWCDALSNYITGAGYGIDDKKLKSIWPCDVHIIGKDILRFHAAFWPAMLLSAKEALPKKLFVHGFVLSNGAKMSKSTGNIIEPFTQIDKYGPDQFRFYLAQAMPFGGDGDYNEDAAIERINTELVGNLSNFCYRVLSFTNKNFDSKIKESAHIIEASRFDEVKAAYLAYDFKKAIDLILAISAQGNKYFQDNEPWKLITTDRDKAWQVVSDSVNIVKQLSILISPVVPLFSAELERQLNVKTLKWKDLSSNLKTHKINEAKIVAKRIEKEESTKEEIFLLDLRVASILSVAEHPSADKLYVLSIDLGSEKRQLVAGLRNHYTKEELIGKKIVVVANLKPAKLRGVDSFGMLLAGEKDAIVGILYASKSEAGASVFAGNLTNNKEEIKYDQFEKIKLVVKDGKVFYNNYILKTKSEEIKVDKVSSGTVG